MSSSDPRRPAMRFHTAFVAAFLMAATALLALCWLTDPTGLMREAGLSPSLCSRGIHTGDDRYVKPLLVPVLRPTEVILGSSRSQIAFAAHDFRGRRAANLAMAGATFDEVDRLARQAIDSGHVRRIWIGLEFGAFIAAESQNREPMSVASSGPRWVAIRHGLLDARAIRSALRSALIERSCSDPLYTPQGFQARAPRGSPTAAPYERTIAALSAEWEGSDSRRRQLSRHRLQRLADLLSHAERRGIEVVAFTGPVSTHYRAALARERLSHEFERWLAAVQRLTARQGGRFVGGHSESLLEPIRTRHCGPTREPDCLFIDATHFRPEVGEAIVREALGPAEPSPFRPLRKPPLYAVDIGQGCEGRSAAPGGR